MDYAIASIIFAMLCAVALFGLIVISFVSALIRRARQRREEKRRAFLQRGFERGSGMMIVTPPLEDN